MGRNGRRSPEDRRWEYFSCDKKKKMKSGEASKIAAKFNQRKYECPFCGHWHLTKQKGESR